MAAVTPCEVPALYASAQALLNPDDARNNLILGVLKSAAMQPGLLSPFGWEVREHGRLDGICVCTPPFPMLLSSMSEAAADAVADAMSAGALLPISINGPQSVTTRVYERLVATIGAHGASAETLRLFELRRVIPVRGVAGVMRVADAADAMQVADFYAAFEQEALAPERRMANTGKLVARLLAARVAFLWQQAGRIVAVAFKGREVGRGASIGPVYTPPAERGRGYASALVAALSQRLLDDGKVYTCLFTDLTNPVSNSIYPKLGYMPLEDFRTFQLSTP